MQTGPAKRKDKKVIQHHIDIIKDKKAREIYKLFSNAIMKIVNKFISFLKLIRFNNLLIIILTQIVIKIFLIDAYLNSSALSILQFCLYLLALISVVAGGYIINDIYDVEIDKINKASTRIINKKISRGFAYKYILYIEFYRSYYWFFRCS